MTIIEGAATYGGAPMTCAPASGLQLLTSQTFLMIIWERFEVVRSRCDYRGRDTKHQLQSH
jgi:hypothetical protein